MFKFPKKLKAGDLIRVVAPSQSFAIISEDVRSVARRRFQELNLQVSFSRNIEEKDEFISSSIESRVKDLHEAFADQTVKGIFSVIGGFNCNQLLPYLDWNLIRKNPKIFIGYSDTTALHNAMLAKVGLITYYGPAYSTFGQKLYFDYTLDHFKKCLMEDESINLSPSSEWTDDAWYIDQNKRTPIKNDGYWTIASGEAEGVIVGGNLGTLNLLQGTPYFPLIKNAILLLEDDSESDYNHFDRDFESFLQVFNIKNIRGIVFGRFQKKSDMTLTKMQRLIKIRPQLSNIPIVANVDFGHTSPIITLPIGGMVRLVINNKSAEITILKH